MQWEYTGVPGMVTRRMIKFNPKVTLLAHENNGRIKYIVEPLR